MLIKFRFFNQIFLYIFIFLFIFIYIFNFCLASSINISSNQYLTTSKIILSDKTSNFADKTSNKNQKTQRKSKNPEKKTYNQELDKIFSNEIHDQHDLATSRPAIVIKVKKYLDKYQFMSIKSVPTMIRTGPGPNYKAQYLFIKKFEPVKLLDESGDWIKIQDYYGDIGWIHQNLLSKTQYIIILKETNLYRWLDKKIIGILHEGVRCKVLTKKDMVTLKKENQIYVECNKIKGYIENKNLWGI